jgi:nucleoside-diphosphate-sugar epimerase
VSRRMSGTPSPKIAGLKLAEAYRRQHGCDYISVMPTNLYGRCDNYHPEHGHVPAARKDARLSSRCGVRGGRAASSSVLMTSPTLRCF